jgi:hypothetical protein
MPLLKSFETFKLDTARSHRPTLIKISKLIFLNVAFGRLSLKYRIILIGVRLRGASLSVAPFSTRLFTIPVLMPRTPSRTNATESVATPTTAGKQRQGKLSDFLSSRKNPTVLLSS